jgi:ATP-dependent Clp protease adapter protein ClpS
MMPTRTPLAPVTGVNVTGEQELPLARSNGGRWSYAVVLHDDRRHTLRYCKALLCEVFGMSETAATVATWVVNTEGRGIIWMGQREEARRLCAAVVEFQHRIDAGCDGDSVLNLDAGHPPMRTTIERVASEADTSRLVKQMSRRLPENGG